ncbi:MAG: hypothetical protein IKO74_09305 [Selenomonadaceae bacterium]|nr:hypothetical protein [Selenomonadaceae bacterium]
MQNSINEEKFFQGVVQCSAAQDLTRVFTLAELVEMTRAGFLQQWLAENFSEEAAQILSPEEISSWNDDDLKLALCEALAIDTTELSDYDTRAIERALNRRHLKEIFIDKDAGDMSGTVVTNQRELNDALNAGDDVIYLVGGVFQIPLHKGGVTYFGRENAIVEIPNLCDVDFDRAEISLNDLQIFVRHPITIKYAESKNLIFLRGDKISRDDSISKVAVYKFLRGRQFFESLEDFSRRAEKMTGIVVGKTILDARNYDLNRGLFILKIDWYLDFVSVTKNFAAGKFFACKVAVDFAKKIYETERAQLVYADFCASGDLPAIKNLYLITSDGTRLDIFVSDIPNFEELVEQNQSGTSGGGGYGLELVENFNDEVKKLNSVEDNPPSPKETFESQLLRTIRLALGKIK